MDNINYFNSPTAGSSNNSGQNQPQPGAGLNQPVFFAEMDIRVRPSEQALTPVMPQLPYDYHQTPEPRQLSTLDDSPHSATQHLPQVNSPPLDPFLAIATYQPFQFDEGSQLESLYDYDPMEDIDELLKKKLMFLSNRVKIYQDQYKPSPSALRRTRLTHLLMSTL